MSEVRFGLVGAGAIAQTYAQAFRDLSSARLVGVADIRADACRALAERAGCGSYFSAEALVVEAKPEAVVVCTPPATHADLTIDLLQRGAHVLCEKPLSVDAASAWRMLHAATRSGALLTMASKFRYVEDVVSAKSIVDSGAIGEVVLFENAFTSRVDMSSRWNADPATSGGGVLIDNGSHSLDLMRYFLGPLAAVQVVEGKRVQGLAVEDTVRVFVRSAGGVMGSIDLSWSIDKELDSYLNVYGSRGTVRVGWKESKYRLGPGSEWVVFGAGYDKLRAFRSQIENFARAIRGLEALRISARDGVASVEVMEAAYRALRRDHWVSVDVTDTPPAKRRASTAIPVP